MSIIIEQLQLWYKTLVKRIAMIIHQLQKKESQECKDQIVLNIPWQLFLLLIKIYMVYISLKTIIILSIGCRGETCFNVLYYIINFVVGPTPLIVNYVIFHKLQNVRKKTQIVNITFLLLQLSTISYNLFVNDPNNSQIVFFLIQVKLSTFCQCLMSDFIFRIISLLLELALFLYVLRDQLEYVFINTLVSIFITILFESFYYQLVQQHKLQFQTLQNLPCGLCIVGQQGQRILYSNSLMYQIIQDYCPPNIPDKASSTFKSLKMQRTSLFQNLFLCQDDKTNFDFNHFVSRLYVSLDNVLAQMPFLQFQLQEADQQSQDNEHLVDLQSILKYMEEEKDPSLLVENDTNFSFKCVFIDRQDNDNETIRPESSKNKILIEVRIKRGFKFQQHEAIMMTFYDISQTLKFHYYKSLNNFKSKMIKSISHELRTRLNIIQGMIEIVLSSEPLSQQANQLLDASYQNCKIQALIIGSIIDYHLIQEKQLNVYNQKCMMVDIIQESIELFKEEFLLKELSIKFINKLEEPIQIEIDSQRLLSVLVHLISNSLKFTNKGTITLTVTQSYQKLSKQISGARKFYSCMSSQMIPLELSCDKRYSHSNIQKMLSPIKRSEIKPSSVMKVGQLQTLRELIYKIEIKDTGLGMTSQKLQKVQNIIESDANDDGNEDDSAEGSMMGIRVINQLLKYLNNDGTIQYLTIESEWNQGTTVTIFLRTSGTALEKIDTIGEEGTVKRRFQALSSPLVSFNMTSRNLLMHDENVQMLEQQESVMCQCDTEILMVDDEPYNLLVLGTLMRQFQQITIQAYDGQSCVELVKARIKKCISGKHKCGVLKAVLMDYQMPLMNGRQAAEIICGLCTENKINTIPIFGITGFSSEEDIMALQRAGMIKVYTKPITKDMIKDIMRIIKEYKDLNDQQYPVFGHISLEQISQDDDDDDDNSIY